MIVILKNKKALALNWQYYILRGKLLMPLLSICITKAYSFKVTRHNFHTKIDITSFSLLP
ncbi:hypothetical protein BMWSH_p311 (plasmid) [Priestia megaterium WSH-002]|uniref:Uncharacterized protein n=1 Tax=Priestia megaterium (strain WSH-002) TaxID=1006007 RepID=A0A8D3X475_PRIMW|nr:hypothetical protein BMWSH_p311 [Priestia megaterium WSH-002]